MNDEKVVSKKQILAKDGEIFKCSFRPLPEFPGVNLGKDKDKQEYKLGRYHGSIWGNVPNYGFSRWCLGAYIDFNWQHLLREGFSPDDIIAGCVAFLNKKPFKKKKSLYGTLECVNYSFKKDDKGKYICVILSTNERKNKNFWGEGIIL